MSKELADKAFNFIKVVPRETKPRTKGLTIVADRGIGLNKVQDLIASSGDYIDIVKIGIGAFRLQSNDFLNKKVKLFTENSIQVFFAGDISELAYMQGISRKFYEEVKNFGAQAVEVSSAQISMPLTDKVELIKMANDCGLKVIAEAGQKANAEWTRSSNYILYQIEEYLKAGAWKVLIQGEGLTEGVDHIQDDIILNIASRFELNNLIFQAKDTRSQMWFIKNLGNDASMDIDDDQVISVELMRRGLRKRNLFGLVGNLGVDN